MMQRLTNKLLAPHRHNNKEGEHIHQEEHVHHDSTPVAPLEKKVDITTNTHIVDEGIVERATVIKPTIVDEKVRVDTVVEVQPVVHREIEQPIVHHVEQHVIEPAAPFVGGTVTHKPLVQETVTTKVTEEIQPIVHRELAVPKVERVEEHLSERIVEPTVHTKETKHTDGRAADVTFEKSAIVKPVIVDEKVRTDTVVEVQPIIHRDVERTIINHIEQHIVEPEAPFVGGTVRKEAIVDEHVKSHAIEEIQPVVHREVAVPKVEKVEQHLEEHIVAPTQHTHGVSEKKGRISEIVHDKNAIVKPIIMDEKVRTDKVVEIQPIVHREIEKPVVHHIEQHIQEPAAPFVGGTYKNQPIIDEHHRTKVIDEVQPVVHKEKAVTKVEKVEEHVEEDIVAPTQHTHAISTIEGHVSDIAHGEHAIIKPEIVDEKVRTDTIVEVQPIVHKSVEQPVVHHVEEHVVEPAAPNMGGTIRNKAIIDEHVTTNVVDEIQPVVHREVAVPVVEKVEEHLQEHIVAPTAHTREVSETIKTSSSPLPASSVSLPAKAASSSTSPSLGSKLHDLKDKVEAKVEKKMEEKKEEREEKKMEKMEKKHEKELVADEKLARKHVGLPAQ